MAPSGQSARMAGRAWLIVLVVLGAALGGCLGGDAPPADDLSAQGNDTTEGVLDANDSTAAPDGRGDIAAFKETNKTETGMGGMMHAHDYWQGRERVTLLERDMWFVPLPVQPCRADGQCYPPGTSIADIDLPEPMLVYEGTDHLEVKFSNLRVVPVDAAVPNPAVTMAFDYLTAADDANEFRTGVEGAKADEVYEVPVAPLEADMPHQVKSLWLFRIYTKDMTSGADSATSVSVYFNFTVTAVKGREVVDWPPHPDLYANSPVRTIADGSYATQAKGWADYWVSGADANWVYPERVVSYGTERLEVTITKKAFQSSVPVEPDFFYLEYRNASYLSKLGNGDLSGERLVDPSTDGTTYQFTIPVDEYGMDTPYGQSSRWAFRFMARYGDADGSRCPGSQSIMQGCQWFPYALDYDMKIVAHGHSTAAGTKDVAAQTSA